MAKCKYKLFSINKVCDKQWDFGLIICKDSEQFYILFCLIKWYIYIGKLVDWESVF